MAILHKDTIAVYDDSFQPTGTIHWKNDGPWGLPNPHIEMKKLRHELILTIEGPDNLKDAAENCLKQGAVAGAISAVIASFIGAGIGATAAAWAAFQAEFIRCVGNQVQIRIDDDSHWIYWDT